MKRLVCLLCASTAALAAQAEFDASRLWVNAGFYSPHFDTEKGLRNANFPIHSQIVGKACSANRTEFIFVAPRT